MANSAKECCNSPPVFKSTKGLTLPLAFKALIRRNNRMGAPVLVASCDIKRTVYEVFALKKKRDYYSYFFQITETSDVLKLLILKTKTEALFLQQKIPDAATIGFVFGMPLPTDQSGD